MFTCITAYYKSAAIDCRNVKILQRFSYNGNIWKIITAKLIPSAVIEIRDYLVFAAIITAEQLCGNWIAACITALL